MRKIVGYARVSSREQNLDRQLQAFKKECINEEMIVIDKASGKDLHRPGYQSLKYGLGKLVKGDTLYLKSLDRLSRNYEDCKKELDYFTENGIRVKIIDIPTTMQDFPEGSDWIFRMINNIIIEVLANIAENERKTIRKRQREGIDAMPTDISGKRYSKKTGRSTGRPPITFPLNWEKVYLRWKNKELTAVAAMTELGLKKNSFYNLVKKYENKNRDNLC